MVLLCFQVQPLLTLTALFGLLMSLSKSSRYTSLNNLARVDIFIRCPPQALSISYWRGSTESIPFYSGSLLNLQRFTSCAENAKLILT